ncbi:hypothetical protein H4582DRAFT_2129481 [Lactarius indigo]|nr:hypothetical protein H4582DRAFT_2129481 [Lactarius indigo]
MSGIARAGEEGTESADMGTRGQGTDLELEGECREQQRIHRKEDRTTKEVVVVSVEWMHKGYTTPEDARPPYRWPRFHHRATCNCSVHDGGEKANEIKKSRWVAGPKTKAWEDNETAEEQRLGTMARKAKKIVRVEQWPTRWWRNQDWERWWESGSPGPGQTTRGGPNQKRESILVLAWCLDPFNPARAGGVALWRQKKYVQYKLLASTVQGRYEADLRINEEEMHPLPRRWELRCQFAVQCFATPPHHSSKTSKETWRVKVARANSFRVSSPS